MSPTEKTQVCIIGGGPTGIIYLKELIDAGVTSVRVIEAKKTSGGLFRGCYEDSMLTISNSFITFSKMHNSESKHMYCEEYADYCDEFVSKFQLDQYISFETVATKCTFDKENKTWTVLYNGIGGNGARGTVTADYLVVAAGAHAPVTPSSKGLPSCTKLPGSNGLPSFNKFKGTVLHSSEYQTPDIFTGKRALIVGAGESGADIAMAATASDSVSVAVSVRGGPGHMNPRALGKACTSETRKVQSGNGTWWQKNFPLGAGQGAFDTAATMGRLCSPRSQWIPGSCAPRVGSAFIPWLSDDLMPTKQARYLMESNLICGLSTNTQYGTKTAALPQALADGATLVPGIEEVKQQSVVFADGTELEIDLVVLCTGFKTTFPFLEEESPGAIKDFNPRKLWKHMIDPEYGDRLVFGGFVRPAFGSIPQLSEMQARIYAQLITGSFSLPKEKELVQTIAKDAAKEETLFLSSKQIPALTHFAHYSADMASLIDKEIDYRRLLITEPRLFLRLAGSPYNVKRFYINDDDQALRHDARNGFTQRHFDELTAMDIHVFFFCLAVTTFVDIPMLEMPGVMPPTMEQRLWAWLTLPLWLILMLPSIYEYAILWLFALMSPYQWLYWYRNFVCGGDNKPGDLCWVGSVIENWCLQNLIVDPLAMAAFLVYAVASFPVAILQNIVMKWAFSGEC